MKKSSVYLTDAQKAALAAAAHRSGRSEADVIRDAVEREVRRSPGPPAPAPARPLPTAPVLVGVGVGPGDPGLLTERARQVLAGADRVFAAAVGPDSVGRAEAVVRAAVPDVDVERLVFHTGPEPDARAGATGAAAAAIVECLDRGSLVAFATLGDPHLWSPWGALACAVTALRPGTPVEAVPGIMAWQDLAARCGLVVADGDERVVLATLGGDVCPLDRAAADDATTVVVYRGGRALPDLAVTLRRRGRSGDTVVGELLGQPGERVAPLERVAARPSSHLATAIVPARRDRR